MVAFFGQIAHNVIAMVAIFFGMPPLACKGPPERVGRARLVEEQRTAVCHMLLWQRRAVQSKGWHVITSGKRPQTNDDFGHDQGKGTGASARDPEH